MQSFRRQRGKGPNARKGHRGKSTETGGNDPESTAFSRPRFFGVAMHPYLADLLLEYKAETAPEASDSDWLFPSPYGTGRPRWPWTIQRDHLLPAGVRAGLGPIGWHGFRHSYSTLLRSLQVDLKVQQELLRHSDIRTTMNI